ncbi:methyl-accepting chemotaxis protein CtpH [Maricurvus nonylphenolicus]|uniref:methyl-accepting chemotaxis protein n=1 Tax=Maricurvus nonylphenolicus TaxID=1008307 RepID=UPI0036F1AA5C
MTIGNNSMQSRLLTIVIGGLLIMLAVSLASLIGLNGSINDYRTLMSQHVSAENQINDMNFNFKLQVQEWKNVLLRGHNDDQLKKYWGKFQKQEEKIQAMGRDLLPQLDEGEKRNLVNTFINSHREMGQAYRKGYDAFIASGFNHKEGDKAVKGIDRAPSNQLKEAAALFKKERQDFADKVDQSSQSISTWSSVAVVSVTLLIIALLWLFLRNNFLKPLHVVMDDITLLGQGNFRAQIDSSRTDELGDLSKNLSHMQKEVVEILTKVKQTSIDLRTASEEIDQTASNISSHTGATDQYTNQISTAIQEMSQTVQDVAGNAAGAAEAAQNADSNAQDGLKVMDQTIVSINKLSEEVNNVAAAMDQLEQDTASVGAVLDVIKGIAEQTNLLALNAAIEAARAGEQGRGFAVVADEVRALAQRTQESTAEIQQIIETVQNGAAAASQAMRDGQQQTEATVELATQAGQSIGEITNSVGSIRDMNMQIATAAEEQSHVAEEIRTNVTSMADLARQAHETAQQSTSIANRLGNTSSELSTLTQRFEV